MTRNKTCAVRLLAALAILFATPAVAQKAYKCTAKDGGSVFQSEPCTGEAKQVVYGTDRPLQDRPAASVALHAMSRRCEREWPNDFKMQEYCVKQQTAASIEVSKIWRTLAAGGNARLKAPFAQCTLDWADGDTWDYTMVLYCYRQQESGLQAMDRSREN